MKSIAKSIAGGGFPKHPGQGPSEISKNVPCRHWTTKGHCDLGPVCKFSHPDIQNIQYKTRMCKTYSALGSCPVGFSCSFAHGPGELRTGWPSMGAPAGARFQKENFPTVMCKNIVEKGNCTYGEKCSFAHSEEQLRNSKEQRIIAQNPLYKTTLCKQYTEGDYCELGDNCHFAHGEDELRTLKQSIDYTNDPLYKTVICKKWEEAVNGGTECEYADACRFAHGPDEIREAKLEANSNVLQSNKAISPQYKTVLCNLNDECKFGQANCNFAHSESELRTVQQNLAEINPNYKGTLCKYFMSTGQCEYGSICQYAHGDQEIRKPSHDNGSGSVARSNYNQTYLSSQFKTAQYKTQLCKNYQDTGHCDFASQCQFAHGMLELRSIAQNSTGQEVGRGYETTSDNFTSQQVQPHASSLQPSHYKSYSATNSSPISPHYNAVQAPSPTVIKSDMKPVKVVLCEDFKISGKCLRGDSCSFAHGLQELHEHRIKQVPNYRTTMCESFSKFNMCMYGDTCMYAHGAHQLRNKFNHGQKQVKNYYSIGGSDCKRFRM